MRLPFALLLLLGACEPGALVEVGIIDHYGEADGVLEAPLSARVGEPITVVVNTYGGGCISAESISVGERSGAIELTPFDRDESPGRDACTLELRRLSHPTDVEFAAQGTALLIVHGRRVTQTTDEVTEMRQQIVIE